MTKRSRRGHNENQEKLLNGEVSETAAVRDDNRAAAQTGTERRIPPRGRGLHYVPKSVTLPAVKSKPIGTWESFGRTITTPEDAAVISRDNLARDTQEVFTSIVTDKDGEILAVNQHSVGGPNQSRVFPYVSAGQILNVTGAGRAWIVHNHPSGESQLSPRDLRISAVFDDLLKDTGIGRMPINCDHAFLVFLV